VRVAQRAHVRERPVDPVEELGRERVGRGPGLQPGAFRRLSEGRTAS
jgi:hypothetical protein